MKKINLKPIIITVILIVVQTIIFVLTRLIQGSPYVVGSFIDDAIPFNIMAVIPYSSWYFLLFIVPYILYVKDRKNFIRYSLAYTLVVLISNVIFVLIPSTVVRPPVTGKNILELMARLIFWIDNPPLNCFPSLHCGISCLWFLYVTYSKETNNLEKLLISFISVLIMISTLVIKQHVLVDLICGDGIAILAFIFINKDKVLYDYFKKLFKL